MLSFGEALLDKALFLNANLTLNAKSPLNAKSSLNVNLTLNAKSPLNNNLTLNANLTLSNNLTLNAKCNSKSETVSALCCQNIDFLCQLSIDINIQHGRHTRH